MAEPDLADIAVKMSDPKVASSASTTNYLLFEILKQLVKLREESALARRT